MEASSPGVAHPLLFILNVPVLQTWPLWIIHNANMAASSCEDLSLLKLDTPRLCYWPYATLYFSLFLCILMSFNPKSTENSMKTGFFFFFFHFPRQKAHDKEFLFCSLEKSSLIPRSFPFESPLWSTPFSMPFSISILSLQKWCILSPNTQL